MRIININMSRIAKSILTVSGLMLLLFGCSVTTLAQDTEKRGFQPAGSYGISDLETINTTNRNMMFHVPLASLPPGRGGLSAGLNLTYNSKLWDMFTYTMTDPTQPPGTGGGSGDCPEGQICEWWPPVDGGDGGNGGSGGVLHPPELTRQLMMQGVGAGWDYNFRYYLVLDRRGQHFDSEQEPQCPDHAVEYQYKLKVVFPDGGAREFQPVGYFQTPPLYNDGYYKVSPDGWVNDCQSSAGGSWLTTTMVYSGGDPTNPARLEIQHDSDGNWMNNPWTLFFADGTKVTGGNAPERIYDRNDNYIEIQTVTYLGSPSTKIVDQFGRSIIVQHASTGDNIYVNGVGGTQLVTTVQWEFVWVKQSYHATPFNGNSGWPFDDQVVSAFSVPGSITLPTTSSGTLTYQFAYNGTIGNTPPTSVSSGWGELSQVTLPSGLIVTYGYDVFDSTYPASTLVARGCGGHVEQYQDQYDSGSVTRTEGLGYGTQIEFNSQLYSVATITGPDGSQSKEHFDTTLQNVYKSEKPDGTVIDRIGQAPFIKTEFTSVSDATGALVKTAIKDYDYDFNGNVTRVSEYDWVDYSTIHSNGLAIPPGITPKRVRINTYANQANSITSPNYSAMTTAPRVLKAIASSEVQDGSGTAVSRTENYYDNSTTLGTATQGNLTLQKIWDSTRGAISRPLTSSNSVSVSHTYDSYGNPTSSTDAKGTVTSLTYDSNSLYVIQTNTAVGTNVQQTATMVHDFDTGVVTSMTDPNGVLTNTTYDVFGRPTLVAAAAGISGVERRMATEYSDVDRRVIVRSDMNTLSDGALISIEHYDQLGRVRLARKLENSTDSAYIETTGIKVQTRYFAGDVNSSDPEYHYSYQLVSNPYRAATSSAASSEPTMGWTRSRTRIGLEPAGTNPNGHVTETETFTGGTLPGPNGFWGTNTSSTGKVISVSYVNQTLVTDQAGKQRMSQTNALGQLTDVWEITPADSATESIAFPNASIAAGYHTIYTYDTLNNLTQVNQRIGTSGSNQTRSFAYDSVKRLSTATNPESGAVSYTYDNNGNLITKTDGNSSVTTMTYDALNRVTAKSYTVTGSTAATPNVSYFYDNQTLPFAPSGFNRGPAIGRLVAVTTASPQMGSFYGYDAAGEIKQFYQRTDGYDYGTTGIGYNLAGAETTETYPSGRTVAIGQDTANRLLSVASNGSTMLSATSYAASGALLSETYGNNLIHAISYNSRLQPTEIKLGTSGVPASKLDIQYGYGTTNNNGNILTQSIGASTSVFNQSYNYDALNRLTGAQETPTGGTSWSQAFSYDRYGNRTLTASSTGLSPLVSTPTIDTTTNRFVTTGGAYGYDNAGNLTQEVTVPGSLTSRFYAYDAENHMTLAKQGTSSGSATLTGGYVYDGEGRRVKKTTADNLRMVYNPGGQLIAEYDLNGSATVPTKEYVYGANGLLAAIDSTNGTLYTTSDHLGSPRVVTNSGQSAVERHDYAPFGEEIPTTFGNRNSIPGYGVGILRQKFTSKERDTETGLDYFEARYYSSVQGRFLSPDAAPSNLTNPQKLNKYRYALNNPLLYIDPDGNQEKGRSFLDWVMDLLWNRANPELDPENPREKPPETIAPGIDPHQSGIDFQRRAFDLQVQGSDEFMDIMSVFDFTGAAGVGRSGTMYISGGGSKFDFGMAIGGAIGGALLEVPGAKNASHEALVAIAEANLGKRFQVYGEKAIEAMGIKAADLIGISKSGNRAIVQEVATGNKPLGQLLAQLKGGKEFLKGLNFSGRINYFVRTNNRDLVNAIQKAAKGTGKEAEFWRGVTIIFHQ